MYIQNRTFNDEENLLEQLFDFSLGEISPEVKEIMKNIDQEVLENETFQKYRASLTDEEDILELDEEERRIRLAERLMELFQNFEVADKQLFGVKASEKTMLYSLANFQ